MCERYLHSLPISCSAESAHLYAQLHKHPKKVPPGLLADETEYLTYLT